MDINESNRTSLLDQAEKYQTSIKRMSQEAAETVIQPLRKRNIFVDALAILFGMSSWIGTTSTFLQLPLIVPLAPEGWSLPSWMAITIQSANIGSFAYVLYQKFSPKKIDDGILVYFTLIIGCTASICTAFFYQHTVDINGSLHSVALLVFTFMFAMVGCLSSVLFMPYMGRFRECYLVSYMLGMGLNGFIPSVLTLIQGVGGPPECIENNSTNGPEYIEYYPPPLFDTRLYFEFIFGIFVLSTVAFVLLNNLSTCKKEYAAGTVGTGNDYRYEKDKENSEEKNQNIPDDVRNLSMFNYVYLMAVIVGLSGLGNGIFPGIMTYACLPYGNITYHLTVTLAAIASPCAGFIAMFVSHTSIRAIRFLSAIGSILAIYIFCIAVQSPNPPMKDSILGDILIITSFSIITCIIGYMKISIVSIFRYQEGRSLVWVGTVIQISAAIGSVITYVLVNLTNIFVASKRC